MENKLLSDVLLDHYNEAKPIILDSVNSMIKRNYRKIMDIWDKTGNPVPLKKAKRLNIGGRNYYYIVSLYMGHQDLECSTLEYTFINSEEESPKLGYTKDLIFFADPKFKMPDPKLKGLIRYTAKFLELYCYTYGQPDWSVLDISERWIRRNSRPLFIITSDPVDPSSPSCNVIGKDYEEDGVCLGRFGKEDMGMIKFVSYYPEDVLEDIRKGNEPVELLLSTYREFVKKGSYKNHQDRVKWPDKFMLNKYWKEDDY